MSDELKPCPFCGEDLNQHGDFSVHPYGTCFFSEWEFDALNVEKWNRRTAPVSAPMGQELPPIEYDKSADRTYIPLPGGWEIQTKGNGSTFRIAHAQQQTRWQVLEDRLHEPLEAMARDTRNMIEQYAERIRQLERELAERASHPEILDGCGQCPRDTPYGPATCGKCMEAAERKTASIDTAEFWRLVWEWRNAYDEGPAERNKRAHEALIAYIDGRTAGAAPEPANQAAPNPDANPARDPLYDKAVMIVRARNRASVSLVQRELLIGYNRASRLFDAMEAAGVISPVSMDGYRTVLAAAPTPMNSRKE